MSTYPEQFVATSLSGFAWVGFCGWPPAAAEGKEAWGTPPNPRQGLRPWTPLPKTYPCELSLVPSVASSEGRTNAFQECVLP